jgi:outer membrane protein
MIKKMFALLSLPLIVGSAVSAETNELAVAAVYVVDMQMVVDQSKIGVEAVKKVKTAIAASEKVLNPKKTELENERKNLEKQAGVLSEKAFSEKQAALIAKNREFSQLVAKEQEKVGKVRADVFGQVIEKARKAIEEVSVKNNYSLVVEKGSPAVLYSSGAKDITKSIIEKIGG